MSETRQYRCASGECSEWYDTLEEAEECSKKHVLIRTIYGCEKCGKLYVYSYSSDHCCKE